VVVELAGDTRGRRFLTASSKASQSTSGRWCGRQGEQSPHVSGDVIFCCYSPLPGKSWGWYSKEGSSVFPQARKVRMVGKNGRMEGKSLLSSTAQGPRIAWRGKLGSGSGWALCENAGGGTRKVRGWQRGQKSLRRITLRRADGPQRQKIENRIRSDWSRVFRASSAWDYFSFVGSCDKKSEALPQHHDGSCYAVQNEGLWKQSSWLLAQGILGFQWLKTRVQSAEASTGCWSC
jgi:hypothetical protein